MRSTSRSVPRRGGVVTDRSIHPENFHFEHDGDKPMYDMYPDWGPASHHPDNPRSHENVNAAVQASLDLRDNGGQRPDDN